MRQGGWLVVAVLSVCPASRLASQDPEPLRLATGFLFDSSEHPGLSELLTVTAGFFAPDSGIVLVDRTRIHIVHPSSGTVRAIGREGEGPEEFRRITHAVRAPGGVAVWDMLRYRVAFISHDGEFLRSRRYLDVPFKGFANVRPVAVRPDGMVVFRDEVGGGPEGFAGRIRHPARFVAVGSGGGLEVLTEARGDEWYYQAGGKRMSDAVLLGHLTLTAATRDRFLVADTQTGTVAVLDWSGRGIGGIPMPAAVRPSADEIRLARQAGAEVWRETGEQMIKLAAEGSIPFSPEEFEDFPTLPPDWPVNEVAPPIDAIVADFDARVWIRDYRLPGHDSVTWRVWDIDRERLLFSVRLDGYDTLLDARGDMVLLRRVDEFEVPRVVVGGVGGSGDGS